MTSGAPARSWSVHDGQLFADSLQKRLDGLPADERELVSQHSDALSEWVEGCFSVGDDRGFRAKTASGLTRNPSVADSDATQKPQLSPGGSSGASGIDTRQLDDSMMLDFADLAPITAASDPAAQLATLQQHQQQNRMQRHQQMESQGPAALQQAAAFPSVHPAGQPGLPTQSLMQRGACKQMFAPTMPLPTGRAANGGGAPASHHTGVMPPPPTAVNSGQAFGPPQGMAPAPPGNGVHTMSWTVHDGQFFAEHLREKRPRAPNEMRRAEDEQQRYRQAAAEVERWRRQHQGVPQPGLPPTAGAGATIGAANGAPPLPHATGASPDTAAVPVASMSGAALGGGAAGWPAAADSGAPTCPMFSGLSDDFRSNVIEGQLYRRLLDMVPAPVFVRTAKGEIIFANRSGLLILGEVPGMTPAPWQVTPQITAHRHPSRAGKTPSAPRFDGRMPQAPEGELDLPPDPVPLDAPSSVTELPAPSTNYYVLLQGRTASTRTVLPMHRIPFWLATEDSSNTQRAVVLYVAPVPGDRAQVFFPAISAGTQRRFM